MRRIPLSQGMEHLLREHLPEYYRFHMQQSLRLIRPNKELKTLYMTKGMCKQYMIQDGKFLQSDFFFFNPDGTKSTGNGISGFDPKTNRFITAWYDSRQTTMFTLTLHLVQKTGLVKLTYEHCKDLVGCSSRDGRPCARP
jgi:hypothetical protein